MTEASRIEKISLRGKAQRLGAFLALCSLLLVGLVSQRSEARLEPYYVVNGLSFGQLTPRILFVLDTSGSMTWRAQPNVDMCEFDECEGGTGTQQSRIHAARLAIHTIVENVGDAANFGFMTFDQEPPPTSNGSIPRKCSNGWRFNYSFNAYQVMWTWWGAFWDGTTPNEGIYWWLCGKNRPYAYLRYDNLGHNISVQNGQDPIPESPILKGNNLWWTDNGTRKVQWFPDFRGVRINVHHNNPEDVDFIRDSWGDYGNKQGQNPSNTQKQQISGKDFYYWPYVDGFTGYSYWQATEDTDEYYTLGHVIEDNSLNQGALYGPFFLESLNDGNFAQEDLGPASLEEARQKVLHMTEDFAHGGVDASGGTPWEATVGPVTAAPPASNGPFSHPTIASYLKFAKNVSPSDVCVPTATILVTDGEPNCAQSGNGTCSNLHKRLDDLRNELDSQVYVVGFFVSGQGLNNMACAGAGACPNNGTCNSPCSGTPTKNWDTCYNSADPTNECAWIANSAEELADALGTIVQGIIDIDVDSGAGASAIDVGVGNGSQTGGGDLIATTLKAHTEFPDWKGHVLRQTCDHIDPDTGLLEDYCQDNGVFDFNPPTFGPCPQSRVWDAGECLQLRDPATRNIYINDASNNVYPVNKPGGGASAAFFAQLNSSDLGLPGAPYTQAEADEIADFIMGVGWKDDWKLTGLANSSPVIVRRIPQKQSEFSPSVGIRDPHCAGRLLPANSEVAPELQDFAEEAWDPANYVGGPNPHHEYQEAAIIGSDLGLVHAFQFDSGNELFAYLPRYNLQTAVAQFEEGGDMMGQPLDLDDHHYGVAATANQGWVWDPTKDGGQGGWRHLLIIGGGKGGQNYSVLDVSHMSPDATNGPLEIMWTTFDPALRPTYEPLLGETWARPALIYHLPTDSIDELPDSSFVIASGYQSETPTSSIQGRTIARVDAIDGSIQDWNKLPAPATKRYEQNFGAVVDLAVGTHCVSRYWGEAQETYFLDPSGRFYRWDLGGDTNHEADWGGPWGNSGQTAQRIATFRACQGTGDSCTISPTGMREPFDTPVAVVSSNRIDDAEAGVPPDLKDASQQDQFLIAFASGSLYDDAIDGGDEANDFHTSLYVVVDDHRQDKTAGITIPTTSGRVTPGSDPGFARVVLSDLERTRTFQPVPDGEVYEETDFFSKAARPVKAPLIRVSRARDMNLVDTNLTGDELQQALDAAVIGGLEVYYIEFTVYEPGPEACDPRFYDEENDVWYLDEGSTYIIRLRLTASEASGFDLVNGAGTSWDDGSGQFSGSGLELGQAQQLLDGDCADGSCGPKHGVPSVAPCDPNTDPNFTTTLGSRAVGYSELRGFSPYERNL